MNAFRSPGSSLGRLDADSAATLIAAAADITLILDSDGMIRDLALRGAELMAQFEGQPGWIGRNWADVVTIESRPKVAALLREAMPRDGNDATPARWRHLNHPSTVGPDVAVLYSAVQVGTLADGHAGRVVAFGRDLRAISTLQQRLVDAQQSLERDYSRMRNIETRYRLLFQMASDAVLILDATSLRVLEGNPAAHQIFGAPPPRAIAEIFDTTSRPAIIALLDQVRASARMDDVHARLRHDNREVVARASLFREDSTALFLLRLSPLDADPASALVPRLKSKLIKLMENAPDGFVVTETDGRIVTANAAFIDMAQLPGEAPARGEMLDRWLGRPGVDLDVLIANLRQHGAIRLFATRLYGEHGLSSDVEVSAASVMNGGQPCFGFAIRDVGRRLLVEPVGDRVLPRSLTQMTALIGRVPLRDLVREATDVVERLCIQAALELTDNNRASAAEMLGLSRQSLYVKLRRHGLGDLAQDIA